MEKGVISASEFDTYVAMVGLQNRLVHGYERVSAEVLYEVVTKQLDDFEKFIGSIMPIIRSRKSDR
ncbi:DUF86 domain-containing protein [Acetomicrobium sp. S15 = DSM 107314]|uniref:DUF86 domain-containing protein n=1 Tax=Acetomicrobium sp. S15 = DSM 107314 TaxID=2529858 RepID=UPI001E4FFACB|nr:DUF86 domain-containing protein [Acetomicrobium sp. S15 = DSM 107314]